MELFAGVDLGGTNVTVALGAADGKVVAERKIPTNSHEGPDAVLRRIAETVKSLGGPPRALGMGVPGLVDLEAGVAKFLPNLPTQWRDVPVRRALGCDAYLLNDCRTATLGELAFGLGRDVGTFAFLALGTGVGGGVVVDGKLRLGPHGTAGEIGHQTILPDGPPCGCGNRGCLETLASAPAISAEGARLLLSGNAPKLHEFVGGDLSKLSPEAMAKSGDPAAIEAIARAGRYVGIAVSNVIAVLRPDLVVIGGGVSGTGELLLGPLREEVGRRVGKLFGPNPARIERSALGDRAGILGALALAARGGKV
jgi:glucokinase